jgi:ferric-dicitrate binding protein FerR (iron transport regulator)
MAREVTLQPVRTRVWWLAAAAVIMLAIVAGVMLLTPAGEPTAPAQLAEVMPQPVVLSGKQYVRLPDGSAVLLNDESELRYEPGFATATRDVFLTGEAYFDIKHNPEKPFRVHTGKVITTVLGTAFNVRAWPQAGEVKVTVDRGKVQVGDSSRTYGTITRDQQIAVNTATYDFRQSDVKATLATEWKSTYLILEDISLVDAAALIEARYHIRIQFENEGLKACRVSATFLNDEDIAQVMTVLTTVTGSTYAQQNNSIVLHGPGCGS